MRTPKHEGARSFLFGIHNPIHSFGLVLAWRHLYGSFPTAKETFCIFIHDVGYVFESTIEHNNHSVLGGKIAERIFGKDYFDLCASHSREYCIANGTSLSKIGYADKSWLFFMPDKLLWIMLRLGGEIDEHRRLGDPLSIPEVKANYRAWWVRMRKQRLYG